MPDPSPGSGPPTRLPSSARRGRLLFEEFTGELSLEAVRGRVALLTDYQRRVHRWFTLSAAMGLVVGVAVGALHVLIEDLLLERFVLHGPWPVVLVLPTVGLFLAHQALRIVPGARNAETTERYIAAFHRPRERLRLRDIWGRLLAAIVTIGSGGSLGLEGPSVIAGASTGSHLQSRFPRLFAGEDARLLGIVALDHLNGIDISEWPRTSVADVMDRDVPSVPADAPLRTAAPGGKPALVPVPDALPSTPRQGVGPLRGLRRRPGWGPRALPPLGFRSPAPTRQVEDVDRSQLHLCARPGRGER